MSAAGAVLALIPARGGSKAIPGKNIKPLGGIPLVAHTIRAAREARTVARVLLSTDSDAIAAVGRAYGADVPFLRPADLAQDDTPMAAVVAHATEWLSREGRRLPEVMLLLQPTTPFRTAAEIDAVAAALQASAADAVVTVSPVPSAYHAHWQCVVRDGALSLHNGDPLRALITRRQDLPASYVRNGAIYAFRTDAFLRTGSIYGDRTEPFIMRAEGHVNLDTPQDWERAEQIVAARTVSAGE